MRKLTLISLAILVILAMPVKAEERNVTTKGNSNVTNVCQPTVVVKSCKSCEKTCKAPKVVYKDRIKVVKGKPRYIKSKPIIKYRNRTRIKKYVRKPKRNRLRLLAGYGPTGVSAEKINSHEAVAYEEKGAVFGLGYDRLVTDRISLGVQAQTNETYLGSVGFDF